MRIGFLGLGNMGAAIAANLKRASHEVTVWNRSADKARPLLELGATLAATPKAAATGRDVVFTMLADDAALDSVMTGVNGLVAGLVPGALHVSMSTIAVATAERLAATHRVLLIDRPGHGGSTRERVTDSTPAVQARMIVDALDTLGVGPAIIVVHSLAGAIGARMALDYPAHVAGLVMLAPVTHPWRGGVGWYNRTVTTPVIGPLLAYTVTLPLGLLVTQSGARGVFLPQVMADDFVASSATRLLLRPSEFLANAHDLVDLKEAVAEQAPRYGEIERPVTIISGDENDKTVSTNIHSRPFAATVKGAKLIVLPGVGHMVQYAAPDLVVSEIEAMAARVGQAAAKAAHG